MKQLLWKEWDCCATQTLFVEVATFEVRFRGWAGWAGGGACTSMQHPCIQHPCAFHHTGKNEQEDHAVLAEEG